MELGDALRTTGAVRTFSDDPVTDSTLAAILDLARFAPSGGNRQPWRVVIVRSPQVRRELGRLMQPIWDEYMTVRATGAQPFSPIDYIAPIAIEHHPNELIDQLEHCPAVLVVAVDLGAVAAMDAELDRLPVVAGASIYPFCWSILLAARHYGLGGVMTTFLSRAEPEASEILGLPERYALAATLMLGVPARRISRLSRRSVADFSTIDRFDGPAFSG